MRGLTRLFLAAAFVIFATIATSKAQDFPSRPVTLIVPFAPGSIVDVVARIIAGPISKSLGQTVVVLNQVGGGGARALDVIRSAPPDGYTVLVTSQILAPSPELAPVAMIAESPIVLVIDPRLPAKTVQEFASFIKANPNKIKFGEVAGSTGHLAALLFNNATGSAVTFVSLQAAGQSTAAVVTGEISFSFQNVGVVLSLVQSGKLRALAVTGQRRSPALPDIPTLVEAGVPNTVVSGWIGAFVSARVSSPTLNRMRDAIDRARQSPEVQNQFLKLSLEPSQVPGDKFDAFVREQFNQFKLVTFQPPLCCQPKTCNDMRICVGTPR